MKKVKAIRNGEIVTKKQDKKQAVQVEKPEPMRVPKRMRRDERMIRNMDMNFNNDRSKKAAKAHSIGFSFWNPQAIYHPQRKKLKGWQKNNRRYKSVS